jgi:uncharacterized protein YbbC (DUF1343 family)
MKGMQHQELSFGLDHFLEQVDEFSHLRFALVTNNSATTRDAKLGRIALIEKGFPVAKIFSLEHGLTAQGDDGVFQKNTVDSDTGLRVISLYGDSLKPLQEDLSDVDAVVFDVPDAGCRFYTYLWTMTYVMEACAEGDKILFILDRPNPTGGNLYQAEGPILDEVNCSSFIGRWPLPVRHSCTLGELATYFASTRVQDLDLNVFKMQNWDRNHCTTRPSWLFVPPSPAITDPETTFLYPGTGLLEGINVNEGRGTRFPFKVFGAPWIHPLQMHDAFEDLHLPGVTSKVVSYTPTFGLYESQLCHGLELAVSDPMIFRPVQTGLRLIQVIASLYWGQCKERLYKTVANPTGRSHLDRLTGVFHSLQTIKNKNFDYSNLVATDWQKAIKPFLLYS